MKRQRKSEKPAACNLGYPSEGETRHTGWMGRVSDPGAMLRKVWPDNRGVGGAGSRADVK